MVATCRPSRMPSSSAPGGGVAAVSSDPMPARPAAPAVRGQVRPVAAIAIATQLLAAISGCATAAWSPDFASDNPPQRTAAIEQAVRTHRPRLDAPYAPPMEDPAFRRDLAWLVVMLQSWDPATRLLAIEALETLTGTSEGYDPSGPLPERAEAIERWVAWLRDRGIVEGETLPPIGLPAPSYAAGPSEPGR